MLQGQFIDVKETLIMTPTPGSDEEAVPIKPLFVTNTRRPRLGVFPGRLRGPAMQGQSIYAREKLLVMNPMTELTEKLFPSNPSNPS